MDEVTLRLTLKNSEGGTKTLALENPVDELTLTQIRTAFSTLLNNGWILDASGALAYTSVSDAAYITVQHIDG